MNRHIVPNDIPYIHLFHSGSIFAEDASRGSLRRFPCKVHGLPADAYFDFGKDIDEKKDLNFMFFFSSFETNDSHRTTHLPDECNEILISFSGDDRFTGALFLTPHQGEEFEVLERVKDYCVVYPTPDAQPRPPHELPAELSPEFLQR